MQDKPTDLSIAELKETLKKKGFSKAFTVDIQKLKKLKEFVEKVVNLLFLFCKIRFFSQPDNRPLSEKITFVQCCADITKKRAELLQEFESRLKVKVFNFLETFEALLHLRNPIWPIFFLEIMFSRRS